MLEYAIKFGANLFDMSKERNSYAITSKWMLF